LTYFWLIERLKEYGANEAIIWRGERYSFRWLVDSIEKQVEQLNKEQVPKHSVVALEADFSPHAVATMCALVMNRCIVVPIASAMFGKTDSYYQIAEVEYRIAVGSSDLITIHKTGKLAQHELYMQLRSGNRSGLVLFSSGSTGQPKAALHNFDQLLEKFKILRNAKRMITFLLFDHIGGINTLFYILSNGGCAITVEQRTPDAVCQAIDEFRAQTLPTSPTFIKLLLLSEVSSRFDLSSLELITYGTEVMPESTLKMAVQAFPKVQFLQTYGLSELGILRSKSKAPDSLWVKIGGEGFETRVINGLLEIKAQSAMLGYLNAPSPFTEDGWFRTGDAVEVDGDYFKILGRQTEIINVGGEKVYPAEVESVLTQLDGVGDVVVHGESNLLTGQIVVAEVTITTNESADDFKRRLREFCRARLKNYQIPQKVIISQQELHSERFKKSRKVTGSP
jgi:long-chain acyl-CoA synthetase